MNRYPPRPRTERIARVPPQGVKTAASAAATTWRAAASGDPPSLTPRRHAHAWAITLVHAAALYLLALLLQATIDMWPVTGVPGRVALAIVAAATAFTAILFLISLLVYALPVALHLRQPRRTPTART